ncbi:MAG TPA: thiamine phosphate synthase [Bryobacteraceae bacterium]|nr:thiamine phosphate synthase [Bryobacteraceae bacterium]
MIRIVITAGAEPFCAGADFVQVREPELEARALARVVRGWMAAGNSRVLVNDRTDVAIACGAAGVHLRDHSIAPSRIRQIAPAGFVITVACHDADGVFRAADEGADYAVLAPIFAPVSKPATTLPLGLDALRAIAAKTRIPVIALGGITSENAPQCVEAGAAGVAGITLFRR